MGRPLELLCLYFFACEQRYMRSATPTLSPLYLYIGGADGVAAGVEADDESDDEPQRREKRSKRAPSAYNLFMKAELAKVKAERPNLDHKQAFKVAASRWSKQTR